MTNAAWKDKHLMKYCINWPWVSISSVKTEHCLLFHTFKIYVIKSYLIKNIFFRFPTILCKFFCAKSHSNIIIFYSRLCPIQNAGKAYLKHSWHITTKKKTTKVCGCPGGFTNEIKALGIDFVIIVFKLSLKCHATEIKIRSETGYCLLSEY